MPKKTTEAELKVQLKAAKTMTREAKAAVTATQRVFVAEPNKDTGKAYRTAVSDHIKAAIAQRTIESKLS